MDRRYAPDEGSDPILCQRSPACILDPDHPGLCGRLMSAEGSRLERLMTRVGYSILVAGALYVLVHLAIAWARHA